MPREGSSFFTLPAMHSGARSAKPKHEGRTPPGSPPTRGVLYIECPKTCRRTIRVRAELRPRHAAPLSRRLVRQLVRAWAGAPCPAGSDVHYVRLVPILGEAREPKRHDTPHFAFGPRGSTVSGRPSGRVVIVRYFSRISSSQQASRTRRSTDALSMPAVS